MNHSRRLPALRREACDPAQGTFFDSIIEGPRARAAKTRSLVDADGGLTGPFNAWAQLPEVGTRWSALGEALRFNTGFERATFELAVLTIAASLKADYEWAAHEPIARAAGLAPTATEAIARDETPRFESSEQDDVHAFVRELARQGRVSQPIYDRIVARFGATGAIELVSLVGYYVALALTLNAFEVAAPEGHAVPWAPSRSS